MELSTEQEQGTAKRWFFTAGLIGIIFSTLLWYADERLSNSPREENLRETLFELRSAQTTLPSRATDTRQFNGIAPSAESESK